MAEGQDSTGERTNESLAPNAEEHTEQEQQDAQARQAAYDYAHTLEQYRGGRSLRVPDGDTRRAHYVYRHQEPRSHVRTPHYRGRQESRNYARPSYAGQRDASYAPYGKGHDIEWYRSRYGSFVADIVGFWRAFWYGQ
jgi:hypothetical protein